MSRHIMIRACGQALEALELPAKRAEDKRLFCEVGDRLFSIVVTERAPATHTDPGGADVAPSLDDLAELFVILAARVLGEGRRENGKGGRKP